MNRNATRSIYGVYAALVVTYAALIFFVTPVSQFTSRFHISAARAHVVLFAYAIPFFAIWLAGFYGFDKLSAYCRLIRGSKDGAWIRRLTLGILFLVLWPPLTSISNSVLQALSTHHELVRTVAVVLSDYLRLVWPLIGIILIATAARGLNELARLQLSYRAIWLLALAVTVIGTFYTYAVIATHNASPATFPLPLPITLLTLVIPRTFLWFIGLLASYQILRYQRKVNGIVYRRCWRLLAYGVGTVVVLLMVEGFLEAFSVPLGRLSLPLYLVVVFAVMLLLAIGYLFIARGARNLQRIEEV